ncbi:hypothetical protein BaRGS_00015823, partial [Batillaria attramentaria]
RGLASSGHYVGFDPGVNLTRFSRVFALESLICRARFVGTTRFTQTDEVTKRNMHLVWG